MSKSPPKADSGPAGCTPARGAGRGLLACVAVSLLTGGCAGDKLTPIVDAADFELRVLGADMPIMVEFYKTACPTCVIQENQLAQLAAEYEGRVTFAKFLIKDLSWSSTAPTIQQRYELFWVPTTILFVDGQERRRWELNHLPSEFRAALDEAAGAASPPRPAKAQVSPPAAPHVAQWPADSPN